MPGSTSAPDAGEQPSRKFTNSVEYRRRWMVACLSSDVTLLCFELGRKHADGAYSGTRNVPCAPTAHGGQGPHLTPRSLWVITKGSSVIVAFLSPMCQWSNHFAVHRRASPNGCWLERWPVLVGARVRSMIDLIVHHSTLTTVASRSSQDAQGFRLMRSRFEHRKQFVSLRTML
jgi:hypothetical protein